MKNLNSIMLAAAIVATFGLVSKASAQYQPTGDDGITASPKLRQMLNERTTGVNPGVSVQSPAVIYRSPGLEGVTASPRMSQRLAEQKVVVTETAPSEVASPGYRPTGTDGVTASPRLRQQLDERSPEIIIAPLK